MSDIPKWAISRSAKLASLPLGVAGRATIGLGKRIGGRPAEIVASELSSGPRSSCSACSASSRAAR
ncbi:MAG TPA: hypothetical protein VFJ98_10430 [Mycobacteriales bacterium]|nr:hypothetical protein [Mycobacteriales bacterium]